MYENFIALALPAATSVVAVFFGYIYSLKRQNYLLLWTVGWTLFAVHHLGPTLEPAIRQNVYVIAADRCVNGLAALFFFVGAQLYAQRKAWKIGAGIGAGVLVLWAAANAMRFFDVVRVVVPSALLFAAVAGVFWEESRGQETLADRLLAISFVAWGALQLAIYAMFRNTSME